MNSPRPALLTTAVLTSVLLIALGEGSLFSSDDVLYAQMAREMARDGRWITATWLGVEVFEKPPLLLWLLQLTGALFDWSDFGMRLPGVCGAAVTLFYTCRLTNAVSGISWAGAVAGLLTIATVTFTFNARRPMTDPLLCGAIMASLWYTVALIETPGRRDAICLGLAGGLGLLAKWVALGPVALVCAIGLARHRRWRAMGVATLTALVVAGPWFLAMTFTHGGAFWDVFIGYHVAERAGSALVGVEPLTFYAERFWETDGVFGALLMGGLLGALALRRTVSVWLVVGTALVTLVAIHTSSTRLYHYLMPVVPLAAVGTAVLASWRRESLVGLALLGAGGLWIGSLDPTILRPDYAPSSKAIGQSLREEPAEVTVVGWEDYDPALTWYADRPIRFWTQSESMATNLESIDMLRRADAVVRATPERLSALVAGTAPIVFVAPVERSAGLLTWVRGLRHKKVTVDEATAKTHVVVRVEPLS